MDISPPPAVPDQQDDFTASTLFALMLAELDDALPPREFDTPEQAARRRAVARAIVIAAHPRDPIEAATAIGAAVAYQASLASSTMAAAPGLSNDQSTRHAKMALAQQRAFHTATQGLQKRRAGAEPASPRHAPRAPKPAPEPEPRQLRSIPRLPQFQPRDRYGKPIKLHRFQDMTKKQVDATYGDPYDKSLWEAAIEEEEIAIAEQKAMDEAAAKTAQSQPA